MRQRKRLPFSAWLACQAGARCRCCAWCRCTPTRPTAAPPSTWTCPAWSAAASPSPTPRRASTSGPTPRSGGAGPPPCLPVRGLGLRGLCPRCRLWLGRLRWGLYGLAPVGAVGWGAGSGMLGCGEAGWRALGVKMHIVCQP